MIFFIHSGFLFCQKIDDDFIAGKWKIEEVIVPENKFNDSREKKILKELGTTVLHFKGDGHFSFMYDGENKEMKRNIKDFENSVWRTIKGENLISLEKKKLITLMTVDLDKNIVFGFIDNIKLQVLKIDNEKVNFLPVVKKPKEEKAIPEQKIDSVFKQVTVDKESLENSVISKYPVLDGCMEKNAKSCLNKVIRNRILDALDLKKYDSLNDHKRIKVLVLFAIDIDGGIKNITAKSPDEDLTYDLKLIINNLKVITPAENTDGEPMLSTYTIPLTMMIQ
ncbi:hypothetical protein [Aquimarina sp. 2201CG14-23]|uniref:hypothetical protein n=1 Tax=Aquimarina mycalae TaxID=3040073 RepID=UPI0024782B94|nr:hypothetical protein [Aquimarina sp. 2201CG14-23]MDH7446815.1 hypothetical protein [Aquimarina sp. 2201CG14-23]